MKTVYKIFSIVLAGTLSFFSCSEDDAQRELSPEVTPGCQGVFFPVADTVNASAYELEPTDPTEITLQIARTATDAATVPLVAELNEQGV
ncbi:MAG: hypothetical protein LBJ47_09510, partial [Tannerella sp.]|nr:hypothetical protein [Tannerella sp.]